MERKSFHFPPRSAPCYLISKQAVIYQDTQDPAVTVLFKVNDDDTYLAAWTTTPWTLPSNLGLCVGPDIDYVKVFDETIGAHIILAEARLSAYETDKTLIPVEQMKGSALAGLSTSPVSLLRRAGGLRRFPSTG